MSGSMHRKWNIFIHLVLITLVVLSLLATLGIFGSSFQVPDQLQRFFRREESAQTTKPASALNTAQSHEAPLHEVFSPNKLVVTEPNGPCMKSKNIDDMKVLTDLLFNISKDITDQALEERDLAGFRQQLTNQAYLDFEFSDLIPLTFLIDTKEVEVTNDLSFDRLVFKKNEPDAMYVLNQKAGKVYRLSVARPKEVDHILNYYEKNKDHFLAAAPLDLGNVRKYLLQDELTVPALSYMVERQPVPNFLRQLFDSPESIHDYSDGDFQRYFSDDKSLLVNNQTQELVFNQDKRQDDVPKRNEAIQDSFRVLKNYQANVDSWKYVHYHEDDGSIEYRKFINGLPVFGPYNVSKVHMLADSRHIFALNLSTLTIQTPLTPLSYDVKVMSGQEAWDTIEKSGLNTKEVEDIRLGYRWVKNEQSESLIDLLPAWHIKIKGKWVMLEQEVDMANFPDRQSERADNERPLDLLKRAGSAGDSDSQLRPRESMMRRRQWLGDRQEH